MRKRPLFWTGVCLVIFLACLRWFEAGGTAEGGWKEPALAAGDETACLPESFSDGAGIRLSGQVAGCSLLPEGMRLFLHHITVFSADGSRQSVDSDHKIFFYTDQNGFLPGDYIEVQGVCSALQPAANPGQFDAEAYYSSENVICSLKKTEILKYRTPGRKAFAVMWKRLLAAVRHRLCRAYQDVLGEEQAAALAAITLGEKLMLEQEQKTLYQEGGIAHILAISGVQTLSLAYMRL